MAIKSCAIAADKGRSVNCESRMSLEAARLDAVKRYEILDTPPDGAFDRVTRLAARLFHVPVSIVSIVDEDRIWFKSKYGVDVQEIPRSPGLCASAIMGAEPWLLTDASKDPRSLTNPLVAGEFGLRFYLGVPLRTSDGHNLGTLCVIDRKPRSVSNEQLDALKDLASIVVDEMEIRLNALRALNAKDMLFREIHHRIRNNLQVVKSLMHLQERAAPNAAKHLFRQAATRVETMAHLHHEFYSGERIEVVDLKTHILKVARLVVDSFGDTTRVSVSAAGDEIAIPFETATPLSLLVTEVVSNSCKHAFTRSQAGLIFIEVRSNGSEARLTIGDNGVGFRAAAVKQGMGTRLVESFAMQLRGSLSHIIAERGTLYELHFPLP